MTRARRAAAEAALGRDGAREFQKLVKKQRPRLGFAEHVTAGDLVDTWEWLVTEVEQGYDDIVQEYANDLDARVILDRLMAVAPEALLQRIEAWAEPLDRRFLEATVQAQEPFHGSADPASPYAASRWHWRVPKKLVGELKEDFRGRGFA